MPARNCPKAILAGIFALVKLGAGSGNAAGGVGQKRIGGLYPI